MGGVVLDRNSQDLMDIAQSFNNVGYALYNPKNNSMYISYEAYTLLGLVPVDNTGKRKLLETLHTNSISEENLYFKYKEFNGKGLIVTRLSLKNSEGIVYLFILLALDFVDQLVEKMQEYEDLREDEIHSHMVAHEIKNSFTVIKGFLQLLKAKYKNDSEFLDLILNETERANGLAAGFIRSSQPAASEGDTADVKLVLEELLTKLEVGLTGGHVIKKCFKNTSPVQIASKALEQICLNLILNSMESMSRGTIYVYADTLENGYVRIRIADNGCGIASEVRGKIFTYGFTTKKNGSGYGLAIVMAMLRKYNSKIHLTSKVKKGSIFTLLLSPAQV